MQNKPRVITEADQGKEIKLRLGETFTIQLAANPTTGYSWYLLTGPAPWTPVSRKYVTDPHKPNLTGVGGKETFTFKAESVGGGFLRLLYLRGFEEKINTDKAFQVRIVVQK
ncbi:protease inhibitor I42 family protein [Armatimonas rosea]|uniref:Inhibitor of cysteine peptidase n=1 Tax=Armatimonas rosea TaxID=685828 RepID=A0A7W9SPT3_ARMRO|nr:protease inhibitor I42 family protein [Armatimonas rosea]MBB6049928.1 inhibitor of cysteine peptidase [Armatimonas rosea]